MAQILTSHDSISLFAYSYLGALFPLSSLFHYSTDTQHLDFLERLSEEWVPFFLTVYSSFISALPQACIP